MQVPIELWGVDELKEIATNGFKALNVSCKDPVIRRLADESFGSPHLMQDFCGSLCRLNNVAETITIPIELKEPDSWGSFFRQRASEASKTAFDRLAMGPRQRTERMQRPKIDGGTLDIYKAVLLAIANTGPKLSLSYEDLRASLRDVLKELPAAHEISRVLDKMTEIAKRDIEGELVVDWDKSYSTLHVSDPFFAYYLKWAIKIID